MQLGTDLSSSFGLSWAPRGIRPESSPCLLTKTSVGRLPSVNEILGRISTNAMPKESPDRIELLQGTLDMLILRTLLFGPAHGHQIAKHIQRTTEDVLQVEHGSLY